MYSERCTVGHHEPDPPVASEEELRADVDTMIERLNESLNSLYSRNVDAARARFGQFFGPWDHVDDKIGEMYPLQCSELHAQVARARTALLEVEPTDLNAALTALFALRDDLSDFALEVLAD